MMYALGNQIDTLFAVLVALTVAWRKFGRSGKT